MCVCACAFNCVQMCTQVCVCASVCVCVCLYNCACWNFNGSCEHAQGSMVAGAAHLIGEEKNSSQRKLAVAEGKAVLKAEDTQQEGIMMRR